MAATGWLAVVANVARSVQDKPMKSETARLPKGHSYPLRPSVLKAALESAGIVIDTHLVRSPGKLFDAHFWPANANVPYERLYIRAGSVLAEQAGGARDRVGGEVLPTLISWIGDILAQDYRSPVRREQQYLNLSTG